MFNEERAEMMGQLHKLEFKNETLEEELTNNLEHQIETAKDALNSAVNVRTVLDKHILRLSQQLDVLLTESMRKDQKIKSK